MLSSPISVTINGTTYSCVRVNQDNFGSVYLSKENTGLELKLSIRHSYEKATALGQYERHNVDMTLTKFGDPGLPATVYQSYAVIRCLRGSSPDIQPDMIVALATFLNSVEDEIIAWES